MIQLPAMHFANVSNDVITSSFVVSYKMIESDAAFLAVGSGAVKRLTRANTVLISGYDTFRETALERILQHLKVLSVH